jgi:Methylamine utilisation protein MauE
MASVVSIWLVLILGAAGGLKAWRADQGAAALATYGISGRRAQRMAVWALIVLELALAGALVAGAPWAAAATAVLFGAFALCTAAALLAGRGGRPCACFGSSSRLSWISPIRAGALAAVAGVLASGVLPVAPSGYDRWFTLGLSVTLAAVAGLALALLALAREIGVLRLGMGGRGALEILEEGPSLGARQTWAEAIPMSPRAMLAVAVFTSEGCPLCLQTAPAVKHVAADPLLAVAIFDEAADAAIWAQAGVPGSPYAVALDLEGMALAKGTFNSLGQLESILATAREREASDESLPLAA